MNEELENQRQEIEQLKIEVKQLQDERMSVAISVLMAVVLLFNYTLSMSIAKIFNIYGIQVTKFDEITWEWFLFLLFFVADIFIVNEIYVRYMEKKEKIEKA